ncbi:MAG: hypothetical protein GY950_21635 [bacterium]|nr:hypothetical protein [bacterium]
MKLACPQCGGNNQVETPDTFAKCDFCKSSLFIDIDEITVVYTFSPTVDVKNLAMHLKRDFEKTGFNEKIEIRDAVPVYIPFWQTAERNELERASSRFADKRVNIPPGEKIFFNSKSIIEKNIEIISIDTQPEGKENRTLYYVPFFQVWVNFNREVYTFFINAVNGEVNGDPIPFISSNVTFKMFPLFITLCLLLLVFTSVFNNMLVVMPLCLAVMFVFYQVALNALEKERKFKK